MINKDKVIKVINKYNGPVGYDIPDEHFHRSFYPGETKDITFSELEKARYAPGGLEILTNYLEITDPAAIKELFNKAVEPEYHYSREDVKQLMLTGSLEQFLDCLDFSPEVTKEMIKDLAVELSLNDIAKRQAILDKLGFDVTKAIEINNTGYDTDAEKKEDTPVRRTEVKAAAPAPTTRRAAPLKTGTTTSGK